MSAAWSNPRVSIILPVYNAQSTVDRAIKSVQAQTMPDWELLLVDDGSKDESGTICDRWAQTDRRIRVFHTENRGASHARNVGLTQALGEWIAFLDSDDFYAPSFLERMLLHSDCADEVLCYVSMLPEGHSAEPLREPKVYAAVKEALEDCQTIEDVKLFTDTVWNRIIRKSSIRSSFDESMVYNEVTDFVLKNWRSPRRIAVVPERLYTYDHTTPGSLTKRMRIDRVESYRRRMADFLGIVLPLSRIAQMVALDTVKEVCTRFSICCASTERSAMDKLLFISLMLECAIFDELDEYLSSFPQPWQERWRLLKTRNAEQILASAAVWGESKQL